jgi:DNA-binding transcriptional LysR family regulator
MDTLLSLDADLLRAFVLIAEGRSFTQAGALIGRTQSAVSMQIKKLEDILGQPVLSRSKGGSVDLTPHGQYLLGRARQILALNDEVISTFRTPAVAGTVRLGTPDDYAFGYLPPVLKRFAESHPAVQVDVTCASSDELMERLKHGALDLTLLSAGNEPRGWPVISLWHGPLVWITSVRQSPHRLDPLPLALAYTDPNAVAKEDCCWSRAAVTALDKMGRRYRVAYTSGSLVGTHAPVMAGLAVTISALSWLPEGLRVLGRDDGMPQLPDFGIVMLKGRTARQPVTDALASQIEASFRQDSRQENYRERAA